MLNIIVKNQALSLSEEVIAESAVEFANFKVNFSPEWSGYSVTVRFRNSEDSFTYDVANVIENMSYYIPSEVLKRGRVFITVVGVKGSASIATTNKGSFEVLSSCSDSFGTTPVVTPNAYAQYVKLVEDKAGVVEEAKNQAVAAKNTAQSAQSSALISQNIAYAAREEAMAAKNEAVTAKNEAVTAKNDSLTAKNAAQTAVGGFDNYVGSKKVVLDSYTETKKTVIDQYANNACNSISVYGKEVGDDFFARASGVITTFDTNYATKLSTFNTNAANKSTLINNTAEEVSRNASSVSQNALSVKEMTDRVSSYSTATLNALASTVDNAGLAQKDAVLAKDSASSALTSATSAKSALAEVNGALSNYYCVEESDTKFANSVYCENSGTHITADNSDFSAPFKELKVSGISIQEKIPTPIAPCTIKSSEGKFTLHGINALDFSKCTFLGVENKQGSLTGKFTPQNRYGIIDANYLKNFIIPGGTYSFSLFCKENLLNGEKVAVNVDGVLYTSVSNASYVTFTVPKDNFISSIQFYLSYFDSNSDYIERTRTYNNFCFALGALSEYYPYHGKDINLGTALNGIRITDYTDGNLFSVICDEFISENGYSRLIKRIGMRKLNGNNILSSNEYEKWTLQATMEWDNTVAFTCPIQDKKGFPILCTHFKSYATEKNDEDEGIIRGILPNEINFKILKSRLSGWNNTLSSAEKVSLFRSWLAQNMPVVYYVLETPISSSINVGRLRPNYHIYSSYPKAQFDAIYKCDLSSVNGDKKYTNAIFCQSEGTAISTSVMKDNLPFENFEISGSSYQSPPTPDAPTNISNFSSGNLSLVGNNLLDIDSCTFKNAVYENGILKTSVPAGENCAVIYADNLKHLVKNSNYYTFSLETSSTLERSEKLAIVINDNPIFAESKSNVICIYIPEGTIVNSIAFYLSFISPPSSATRTRFFEKIQFVNVKNSVSEYEPYKGKNITIPSSIDVNGSLIDLSLREIGEIRDKIVVENGRVKLIKHIGSKTLDGTELYTTSDAYILDNTATFCTGIPDKKSLSVLCTHFKYPTQLDLLSDNEEGIVQGGVNDYIMLKIFKSRLTNYANATTCEARAALFASWIREQYNNPSKKSLVIHYILSNPTIYDLTNTNFGKTLLSFRTISGNATAFTTSTDVKAHLKFLYRSDVKAYIEEKDSKIVHLSGTESIFGNKTFADPLTVPTPTSSLHAATKKYVDDADASFVNLNGIQSISGQKTFSLPPVVPDPQEKTQAVNKRYSDMNFSKSILCKESAEFLVLENSAADLSPCSFEICGASTQETIPSPEKPAAIQNVSGSLAIHGKNALNFSKCTFTNATLTGLRVITLVEPGQSYAAIDADFLKYFIRPGENYTFSIKSTNTFLADEKIGIELNSASNAPYKKQAFSTNGKVTIHVPLNTVISTVRLYLSYTDTPAASSRTRLYSSLSFSCGFDYAEYSGTDIHLPTTTILMSAGTYRDSYKVTPYSVSLVKRTDIGTFTGGEEWAIQPNYEWDTTIGFTSTVRGKCDLPCICDKFQYGVRPQNTNDEGIIYGAAPDAVTIKILKSRLTGWTDSLTPTQKVQLFKDWLSLNNITVCYPATVSETDISQTDFAKSISAIKLSDEITYAYATSAHPGFFEVLYSADTKSFVLNQKKQTVHAFLPDEICVAKGITIELYNNQVCIDTSRNYIFEWKCSQGIATSRKFSVTGTAQNIGIYNLTLNIYNNDFENVWSKTSKLNIVAEMTSPMVLLPLGDSLTDGKPWLSALTTLNGGGITTIGTRGSAPTLSEGRSGWASSHYLNQPDVKGLINPFYNPQTSTFDWNYYKTTSGINSMTAVQILLGTNDIANKNNALYIKGIVDNIRKDDKFIPIFIAQTIYRSPADGFSDAAITKFKEDMIVYDLTVTLYDLLDNYPNVFFVPLVLSHDNAYNFPYSSTPTPVNPRAVQTEYLPINAVHPANQGYLQFADIMYSTYCAHFVK